MLMWLITGWAVEPKESCSCWIVVSGASVFFGINKAAIPVRSLLKVIWKRLYNEKWPGLALIFQMNSGFWSKVVASCDYMSCWLHILSGTGIQQSALMLPWLLFSSCYMQEFVIMISCRGFWCLFEWIKSSINLAVSFLSDRLSAFSASDWTNTCFCKNWGSFGFLHGKVVLGLISICHVCSCISIQVEIGKKCTCLSKNRLVMQSTPTTC